ncbi:hypothetical protein [Clostridium sp. BJN0013]|uniref:hypothetical protein n=1 Tax=Clostridium sp. BJN0013 TaxID=3236840 RepID=UPI0034C6122A
MSKDVSKKDIYKLRKRLNLLICERDHLEQEILEVNNKLDKIIGELMHENIKSTLDTE